jgi:hypothetical protein
MAVLRVNGEPHNVGVQVVEFLDPVREGDQFRGTDCNGGGGEGRGKTGKKARGVREGGKEGGRRRQT